MCAIIDTSVWANFWTRPKSSGFTEVHSWLNSGKGGIAIGGTKYRREVGRIRSTIPLLAGYAQAGIAIQYDDAPIDAEAARIERAERNKSDDEHVLALARVSGARILCVDDDDLVSDFKNRSLVPTPKGRVFPGDGWNFRLDHRGPCGVRTRR